MHKLRRKTKSLIEKLPLGESLDETDNNNRHSLQNSITNSLNFDTQSQLDTYSSVSSPPYPFF